MALLGSALFLALSGLGNGAGEAPLLVVELSSSRPEASRAVLRAPSGEEFRFPVGSGTKGIRPEGARFVEGWSLLGRFRVNAILAAGRFEMKPERIAASGKSEEFLREHLFANMSSIDFDGNGAAGEYGEGFVGLEPESAVSQPFGFGDYRGTFRWYSYAVHGTDDETRVGRRSTGGCINLKRSDLRELLRTVGLGAVVEIRAVP